MARKHYTVANLGCANCAAKMEDKISRLPGVEAVTLTFATKRLTVTASDPDALLPQMQAIVSGIEREAKIVTAQRTPKGSAHTHHPHGEDCACGHEHHEHHHHDEHCACGHDHHEHHHDEHCACGHAHHDHHHDEGCTCGHEHHEHHHHDEGCACGHEHHDHHEHHREEPVSHGHSHSLAGELRKLKHPAFLVFGAVFFALGLLLEQLGLYGAKGAFVLAYTALGFPILYTATGNLVRGHIFDENFLMSIATLGAFAIGEYPEAVGVMLFFRVGEFFEEKAVERSRKQILEAVDLRPEEVNLLAGEEISRIPAGEAKPGDLLLVRPGDRIPLDGLVVAGESQIDTAPITGEPVPVSVRPGSTVISGCVNATGQLTVQVEKPLEESMVTRILEAVENAAAGKPKIDRFITRFARIYTPVVVAVAALTAVVPSLITGDWSYWVYTALSFLVMSCPCALVLSVPLAFFCGIGKGSKQGILFKGGASMEVMAQLKVIALDKTGTLTRGEFRVQTVEGPAGLLQLCASCEQGSNHPIAKSIVDAAREQGLALVQPEALEELPGRGIRAKIDGRELLCGNEALLEQFGIAIPTLPSVMGSRVLAAVDGLYAGNIVISDTIKPDAAASIAALQARGLTPAMLTGDGISNAQAVARQVGISQVFAELLPQQKLNVLQKLRRDMGKIMFIGDGINDAPVLAGSDVGAAMGSGADAAIEAADVVFLHSNLGAVVTALDIAQRTKAIAWQNVVFALAIKFAVMILGLLGFASMWLAVFADSGVAMLCVLNAVRILYSGKK